MKYFSNVLTRDDAFTQFLSMLREAKAEREVTRQQLVKSLAMAGLSTSRNVKCEKRPKKKNNMVKTTFQIILE